MRSVIPMRTAKIGYIVISSLLCVLGIILFAVPEFSVLAIGYICGSLLIVFGVVRLIGYFSKDLYRLAFQYDLAIGIMITVLGTVMLFHPDSLMNFICLSLGIVFLTDGLFKIQIAQDAKKFGIQKWWLIFALAIITAVFGAILVARPDKSIRILTVLIGVCLLCEGVLNIGTMITSVKIIKHQHPDVITADYVYESED